MFSLKKKTVLGAVQKKKLSKKQKKKEKEMMSSFPNTEEEKQKVNERKNRFKTKRTISITRENEPARVIVGTCASLEKKYFRLTTAPDPSQIRPEYVLKDAVEMLKEKWKSRTTDYAYICEQFKSIRQDLTVQHIRNAFTIKVNIYLISFFLSLSLSLKIGVCDYVFKQLM